ncbi:MAG: general stress protein [Sporomusaceae bacterium]|nr:general stress protein [Sporomusaceae bacterium]
MPNQTGNQSQGQATSQNVLSGYSSGMMTGSGGSQAAGQQATSSQGGGMGNQAVIGVFDSKNQAEQAIQALRQQGFTNENISIVTKKGGQQKGGEYVEDDITDGALTGGTLGGIGGLILGAGALAIPGVGPIVAAGPIAAALGGAVAGGVAGGLIDWGIPAEVSRRYEQQVAQGGILAVIHTDSQKVNQAAQILRQSGAKDVESHSTKNQQQ